VLLGREDLACDFDGGKIVTRCTVHVMKETPAWRTKYQNSKHVFGFCLFCRQAGFEKLLR
jgi:hypothetical protein